MNCDLINIKEKYGEKMMHFCRKHFSTILEEEGKLFDLLTKHFAYSRFLYEDIVNNSLEEGFKNYIYSLLVSLEDLPEVPETPSELLDKVGYVLYECKSEEDIQSFKKYYAQGESLCSFKGGRLDNCYVFFVVKKNASEIKREDFLNPLRQDGYGTSVISIQFTRGMVNTLSIKNRYNHTVDNPDATYANNLENIVRGLTKSFEREYNLNISQNLCGDFELPGYVKAKDGKYYKYNYEINNIYYCPDNIIIDNFNVIRDYQEKEKYIIIDYFIIDIVNKKIILYDDTITDSFVNNLDNIKKIEIIRCRETGKKKINIIFNDDTYAFIEIDKYNRIISYKNENVVLVGDDFLYKNKVLENIDMPNVMKVGNKFLSLNMGLSSLSFNKLLEVGNDCLSNNQSINNLNVINLIKVGDGFLGKNNGLTNLHMPNLSRAGDKFLERNKIIGEVYLPNLVLVGDDFLKYNGSLNSLSLPSLVLAGSDFIVANKIIESVYLPKLQKVGDCFLFLNKTIKIMELESLEEVGDKFMNYNYSLKSLICPNLRKIGSMFLYMNNSITKLEFPNLITIGSYFMHYNNSVREFYAPSLCRIGSGFMSYNSVLEITDVDVNNMVVGYHRFAPKIVVPKVKMRRINVYI